MAPLLVQQLAQADLYGLTGRAAGLGVLFHVSIQTVEFERYMFHYLASLPVFAGLLTTVFAVYGHSGVLGAVAKSLLFETVFNASVLLSIVVYRTLFHRCKKFPGPLGAKISKFWSAYVASKNIQYYKELGNFHETYGDFVRTALATYQPRIEAKASLLLQAIQDRAGQAINATDWSMFYSFDVLGEVGFSKDFGNLATGVEHSAIKPIHEHIKVFGVISALPWLMNILGSIPGAASTYNEIFSFCANEIRAKQKVWDSEKYPEDIVSWLLKAVHEKDISAAPSVEALDDDARIVLLAGSDTTASTLTNCLYHLVKYPETQKKMREELRKSFGGDTPHWDYEKVKNVKYIDDFINETLRLRPTVLVAGSRETPPAGIQIDEVHIPGNTNVLIPIYYIQRDPRYWQQAEEFIPERWGDRRVEMETDKGPYFPFLYGAYTCPGKNVAYLSLRIALAKLVLNFDISYAPGEDGDHFEEDSLDTFVVTLPALNLQFTPLKEE
ncbi:hypothetical protein SLS53_000685 [Cytospora paraplurivora]|uniref:Cytochrome P450 n=1 Tax=Cytospora paraplurivora TaxID=2898453 RepID=A0AAN9URZ9_9PEZI